MIGPISQWHEHPRLVAFATTGTGRACLCLAAGALLLWHGKQGYRVVSAFLGLVFVVAVLVTVWPARRRAILSAGSVIGVLAVFARRNLHGLDLLDLTSWSLPAVAWLKFAVLSGGTILGLTLTLRLVAAVAHWPGFVARAPVLTVHGCAWAALALVPLLPPLAVATELVPYVLWRVSYAVQFFARSPAQPGRWRDHFFYLWPMAGVDRPVPIGKGLDYLGRHEALTPLALTGSQLAGVKLLGLAVAWTIAGWCIDAAVYGDATSPAAGWFGGRSADLPVLQDLLEGRPAGAAEGIASMYLQLIRDTLRLAIAGHVLVGCMRLLGFRIYRDVYRPLLAATVLEFWNRRTWYFKELVTEFFFYPTYLRAHRLGPRVRLFMAVFAAAGVGNVYYHALTGVGASLAEHRAVLGPNIASHAVYGTLLAFSIWVSMLRQQARRQSGVAPATSWRRLRGIAGVWSLYAVIHVWSGNLGDTGPVDRLLWLSGMLRP